MEDMTGVLKVNELNRVICPVDGTEMDADICSECASFRGNPIEESPEEVVCAEA